MSAQKYKIMGTINDGETRGTHTRYHKSSTGAQLRSRSAVKLRVAECREAFVPYIVIV